LGEPIRDAGGGGATVNQSKGLDRRTPRKGERDIDEEMVWRIQVRKSSESEMRRNIILRYETSIRRTNEHGLHSENRTRPNIRSREP
jgi:hypothetical protein